jgi:hypothetical protein
MRRSSMWEARSVAAILASFGILPGPIAARSAPPTLNEFLSIISLISFPNAAGDRSALARTVNWFVRSSFHIVSKTRKFHDYRTRV